MPTPLYANTEYIGLILSKFHLQENATFPVKLSQIKIINFTNECSSTLLAKQSCPVCWCMVSVTRAGCTVA